METVETLRADHALMRKKALLLEAAMQVGPEARAALRELSVSLWRALGGHMHREEAFLVSYHDRVPAGRFLVPQDDHAGELRLFQAANELLCSGRHVPLPTVILRLSHALEQLRAQIRLQEGLIFPVVADVPSVGRVSGAISPAMSVNEVLRRYPETRVVFDELRIDRTADGCDTVDEVAWRHGMGTTDVLEQLRHAVELSGSS